MHITEYLVSKSMRKIFIEIPCLHFNDVFQTTYFVHDLILSQIIETNKVELKTTLKNNCS